MHTHIPSAVADASTVAATASVLELLGQHLDRWQHESRGQGVEPEVGIEPTTYRLQGHRSTVIMLSTSA
jgi:hypothetical protein